MNEWMKFFILHTKILLWPPDVVEVMLFFKGPEKTDQINLEDGWLTYQR